MRILVDVDRLEREGVIAPAQAAVMRARAREGLVAFGIDALMVVGVIAVVGGTSFALDDALLVAGFGALLALVGGLALARLASGFGLVANAAAVIGAAMAVIGASLRLAELAEGTGPVAVLGLAVLAGGVWLGWRGAPRLRFVAGFLMLAGALAHLAGLMGLESAPDLIWLMLLYAGAVVAALGVAVDVRGLTFVAVVPLMAALGARSFYGWGSYGLLIGEPTLTILMLAAVAAGALVWARRSGERWSRHGRVLAMAAFLGVNLSFWVASIWGDVVGMHLWGPRWSEFTGAEGVDAWTRWRAAEEAFRARTLALPAAGFAVVWAGLLVAVGVWAALGLRREALNMAASFGGIHGYTQFFTHIDATPGSIALAGLLAIVAAWGLWTLNRRMRAAEGG